MVLLLVAAAFPCEPFDDLVLMTTHDLPVDANAVIWGSEMDSVSVTDGDGNAVTVAETDICEQGRFVLGCLHELKPETGWTAGKSYGISWTYTTPDAQTGSGMDSFTIAADGHSVTPVQDSPTVSVAIHHFDFDGDACYPGAYVEYDADVTGTADPDGLSYMLFQRVDGESTILPMPEGEQDATLALRKLPNDSEHCFTALQIDGAGNETDASEEMCIKKECGCSSTESAGGTPLLLLGFLLRRRKSGFSQNY